MKRPPNIRMQGDERLRQMYAKGKGTKKYLDKARNNGKPAEDKIYVDTTQKTYSQGWKNFSDYLALTGVKTRNLDELIPYMQPFIGYLMDKGYSANTVHTWASGAAKVLGVHIADYDLPKRARKDYKRSRNPVKSDVHFSPANHQDLVDFCRSVGPRHNKELAYIRGTDLVMMEDGRYAVRIRKGKGGKARLAPVYGPTERIEKVVRLMREAGEDLVFPHIPTAADIHAYRAEYACEIYLTHARPLEEIPREDRYCCRKDMAGTVYDKAAMRIASEALGHSRLDVIAQSYLWALEDN